MDSFKKINHNVSPFLKGFGIIMVSFLSIIALVNCLVDPYRYREKRIPYLNYLPVNGISHSMPLMNVFKLYSKGDLAKFSMIGTSHVLLGMSDCNYPAVEKMAVSTMSISESSELLQRILVGASVQKTVFIEVCGVDHFQNMRDDSFYNKILSLRTTIFSVRTIAKNLLSPQTATNAFCLPEVPKVDTLKSMAQLNSVRAPLRQVTDEEIVAIKKIAKVNYKLKNHLQHQVVFFIPPLPSETIENEKYRLINLHLSEQLQKTISSMQLSGSGIKFKFINLTDTEIGKEYQFKNGNFYDGWYDGTHFKPIIGDQIIKYLIEHFN